MTYLVKRFPTIKMNPTRQRISRTTCLAGFGPGVSLTRFAHFQR